MARKISPKTALANFFSISRSPIYLLDDRGTILYCNAALANWVSVPAENLIGRRVEYHSEHAPNTLPGVAAGLCPPPEVFTGQFAEGHVSCQASDGRLVFREGRFEPLLASLEATSGVAGILARLSSEDLSADAVTAHLGPDAKRDVLHAAIRCFRRAQSEHVDSLSLVGQSIVMQTVRKQVQLAASSDAPVAIFGPAGSGKDDVAKAIHYHPPFDVGRQFVPLDGATVGVEELRWAVGALRGENRTRLPSTLLIRNIDEAPTEVRDALRSLVNVRPNDFRIITIATTDPRLSAAHDRSEPFAADLATLLATIAIELLPLSARREDLPLLAQYLVEECNRSSDKQFEGVHCGAIELLATYAWPGGIGEFRNVLTAAYAAAEGVQVTTADLSPVIHHAAAAASLSDDLVEPIDLDEFLARIERELIERALRIADGNKTRAAELLGWNRPRFYRRIEQLK